MSEKFWTMTAKIVGFPVLAFYAYEFLAYQWQQMSW